MSTSSADFILLPFFNRLRQSAGMELDMNQYYMFLDLFMKGYARDKDSLLTLSKTLWLTKREFNDIFERWYEEAFQALEKQWLPEKISPQVEEVDTGVPKHQMDTLKTMEEPKEDPNPAKIKDEEPIELEDDDKEPSDKTEPSLNLMEVILNFDEGGGKVAYAGKKMVEKSSEKDTAFIFSDDKHLPIAHRRLGHALQKLCMTRIFQSSDRFDMPAMVKQLGRDHFITSLKYEQISSSQQHVILLTDHEGSMTAFEAWADFLFHSIAGHPTIGQIERYYFHDYPSVVKNDLGADTFKVFSNPQHTASVLIDQTLAKTDKKATWMIIFSDAGAYENRIDKEGMQNWWQFISSVSRRVAAVTWVNPLPKRRWEGNMAGYLSYLVKMVPFNLEGTKQAIKWANHANRNRTS